MMRGIADPNLGEDRFEPIDAVNAAHRSRFWVWFSEEWEARTTFGKLDLSLWVFTLSPFLLWLSILGAFGGPQSYKEGATDEK